MLKFSKMPYERPDIAEVKQRIQALVEAFSSAATYAEASEQFAAMDRLKRRLDSAATLAQIRHSIDTRDEFYDGEETFWNRTMPELQEYFDRWTRALCASPHRAKLAEEFGEVVFLNAELELKCFDVAIIPLLQEENELNEIVQLVGKDSLSAGDQLTLEIARMLREDFLQQNAFMDVDSYSSFDRQKRLMALILHYEDLCRAAVAKGVAPADLYAIPAREELGWAKYSEADKYAAAYEKLGADMEQQIEELIRKAGEEQ